MTHSYPFTSALITGASSGIGEAMVHALADSGIPVVVVARRVDRLQALAAKYAGTEVLAADLSTPEGIASVAERVTDPQRPVDLVVNNAGFGTSGDFFTLDPDRLDDEVLVNIAALTRISNAALSVMVPRGHGFLLNVSSIASFQPAPRLAVYAATKAYVTSLTESLHEEVRNTGVHVTALCPGLTRTEFQSVSNSSSYTEQYPSFVWLSAAEVAETGLHDVAKGRALSIPGVMYKGMVTASSVAPRGLLRRIAGLVQR